MKYLKIKVQPLHFMWKKLFFVITLSNNTKNTFRTKKSLFFNLKIYYPIYHYKDTLLIYLNLDIYLGNLNFICYYLTNMIINILLNSLLISLFINAFFFFFAYFFKTDKLTDLSYGLSFIALSLVTFFRNSNLVFV